MVQAGRSRIGILTILVSLAGYSLLSAKGLAQLVPDSSLGAERSIVTPNANADVEGIPVDLIEGGARRSANLFHSFSDFNVGQLQQVYFANPAGVENIISRVTGTNRSNILGTLGVTGAANVFLINPNGILFGPNATLNINGSFVASTAKTLVFADGTVFGATSTTPTAPLLTVTAPIGLQYGSSPGGIQVQGATLRMASGRTLALLGGTVSMSGGRLLVPGGRIELGGAAADGSIGLQSNGSLVSVSFPDSRERVDLFLDNRAELNVRGADGGSITLNARTINIAGTSRVRAGIAVGVGTPQSQAGDIELNATSAVQVTGNSIIANNTAGQGNSGAVRISAQDFVSFDGDSAAQSGVGAPAVGNSGGIIVNTGTLYMTNGGVLANQTAGQGSSGDLILNVRDAVFLDGPETFLTTSVQDEGIGNGGNIIITTRSLSLSNGGTVFSGLAGGKGNAGTIKIHANDTVTIDGGNNVGNQSGVRSNVFEGKGNGGDINITTGSLFVRNSGVLNTNVQSLEGGSAGDVTIVARDVVVFDGANSNGFSSKAISNVSSQVGNGGDITITTRSFSLSNGAFMSTQTGGQGNGGDITVRADTVDAVNGGQLITTSYGDGRAGNIRIAATNNTTLSGSDSTYYDRLARYAQVAPQVPLTYTEYEISLVGPTSGLFANTDAASTGAGGELIVNARQFNVQNGAQVTVSSQGLGIAGTLTVEADTIRLDTQGTISADTASGGGNINLRSPLLSLRRNSSITTNATGTATGGNININADFIVSAPNENNDIIANAIEGSGGRITLSAQNIFWFDLRTRQDLQRLLNTTDPIELDPRRLSTNDVTAFSQANPTIDTGTVIVQTPDLDPTRGLTSLPTDLTDPSQLIASTCPADEGSSFSITGRGGLPEDPRQPLMGQVIWRDDRETRKVEETGKNQFVDRSTQNPKLETQNLSPIVEAQTWTIDPAGNVSLIARKPQSQPHLVSWYSPCSRSQH